MLAIHETRFATWLVDALMDRPEDVARRCKLMREYSPKYETEQKARKWMKVEGYIADLGKQAADILRDAEKPWALEAIATSHVYIPFQTFDAFVAACQYTGTTK